MQTRVLNVGKQNTSIAIFPDVVQYIDQCRFNNCLHQSDVDGAIRDALECGTLNPVLVQISSKVAFKVESIVISGAIS